MTHRISGRAEYPNWKGREMVGEGGSPGYQEHLNAETKTPPRLLSLITAFICMMSLFSLTTYFFM